MLKWKDLGTLLMEYGIITDSELREGLKEQQETGLRLGEALVKLRKVNMEDIEWVLCKQLDVPFVIVDDVNVDYELLYKFQKDFLIRNKVLPLHEADDQISIVIEDPFNRRALSIIEKKFQKKVYLSVGNGEKIEELLKRSFKKSGIPALVECVSSITEKIQETSFYRIDFLIAEYSCEIHVFGSGISRHLQKIDGHYTNEDVLIAFDELNVHFVYEQSFSINRTFLAVYPLTNSNDLIKLPAILGKYGLLHPEGSTFSDATAYGFSQVFPLDSPVPGYPYLATKRNNFAYEKSIYVIDAAPEEFQECYVNTYIPRKCPSCDGAGCMTCKDLGYEFRKLEGVYSSNDLKEKLKEVSHG
jgi:type IV pilus assembly protein PilB